MKQTSVGVPEGSKGRLIYGCADFYDGRETDGTIVEGLSCARSYKSFEHAPGTQYRYSWPGTKLSLLHDNSCLSVLIVASYT